MSSLALQLFVNLNKLLAQHPGASPGANYAKQLVDRIKQEQPQLLACSDPTNAHTHALSAFALGLGLRDLRDQDPNQADALAPALHHALSIADEGLEQLGSEEVHLLLTAHEYYKSHANARGPSEQYSRSQWGQARSATDQLPLATVSGERASDDISWRPSAHTGGAPISNATITQKAPASHVDIGEIALPELETASTGVSTFLTEDIIPSLPDIQSAKEETLYADPEDIEHLQDEARAEAEMALTQENEERPTDNRARTPWVAASLDSEPSATRGHGTPHARQPQPMLRAVRDHDAERELIETTEELKEEGITAWGARQRDMARKHTAVPQAALQSPDFGYGRGEHPRGQYSDGFPTESEPYPSGDSEHFETTFVHTESAPDRVQRREPSASRAKTLITWTLAPIALALPPVAFFQAGALWHQGKRMESGLLMCVGTVATVLFLMIGLGRV